MRVALYAIRRVDSTADHAMSSSNHASKIMDKWELLVSLNMCMDILWWSHWEQWNQKDQRDKRDQEQYKKELEHKQQYKQLKEWQRHQEHPENQEQPQCQKHQQHKQYQEQDQNYSHDQKNDYKFAPPAAMLLLSSDLPLGWAVMLRDNFIYQSQMDQWTSSAWLKYLNEQLQPLMKEEAVTLKQQLGRNSNRFDTREAGDISKKTNKTNKSKSTYRSNMPVWLWSLNQGLTIQGRAMVSEITVYKSDALENGPSDLEKQDEYFPHLLLEDGSLNAAAAGYIEAGSDRLSNLLAGRSLLEQELLVLLEGSDEPNKHLPQETYIQSHVKHQINSQGVNLHSEGSAMSLRGAWRLLMQHAQLRGRVVLTSAVAVAHSRQRGASDYATQRGHDRDRRLPRLRPAALLKWAARRKLVYRCRRCGSGVQVRTPCGSCGSLCCAYCEACLTLGRSRACALLVQGSAHELAVPMVAQPEPGAAPSTAPSVTCPHTASDVGSAPSPTASVLDRWGLSPAQSAAAGAALDFLQGAPHVARVGRSHCLRFSLSHLANAPKSLSQPRQSQQPNRFLLWAVTGAGKTEMIFPLLAYVLERGGRALVATPRRDVVLELAPRLKVAFPDAQISTLYGGSPERFKQGNLVIATTHQLMRFSHCFDLVVIDELDAFPYHNDPMLAYAAAQCCKPNGKYILLSATPPITLQKEVQKGVLPHAKVPARFHGHPLPVPKHIGMKGVKFVLRTKQLPPSLIASLRHSVQRGAQIFIFVARIRHIPPLIAVLKRYFPALAIEGTSSEDVDRAEKVLRFRDCDIRMLVTTTILERGVTVKKSDVYILDADSDLFDEASLVQMAGRAGRSSDDPAGLVIFSSLDWTTSQRKAIAQIKQMNTLARKRGYLTN
ncbi:late competence protein required for DNA uptake (superfamily II DNA/RNA helicase) [Paenibacillus turicensis]|uniref:Late competence protein required for DNA uptake (Superfamily II DNA/RNA helicase) n=1 Tax=Paenibacillus turicensis TaxID=160487 RepID=A0ABS4FXG4_9BACL|nr:helicase-related protein [Paenibacillus turicensis]MBP1907242.1 late competence protein required for DNA uptake (superfamily II DNA/RNA helicase) [Paenibacillus turicensis]